MVKLIVLGVLAVGVGLIAGFLFSTKRGVDIVLTWKPEGKVTVVVFSQSKVGNTRQIADWIAEATGGDLVVVERETPYPDSYPETLKAAQVEISSGESPRIKPLNVDLAQYQTVFIGSPVWYGTCAAPIRTFLQSADLTGKTVVPFCTHGGGGEGRTFADIREAAKGAKAVLPGFSARGSNQIERRIGVGVTRTTCKADVVNWLNGIRKE